MMTLARYTISVPPTPPSTWSWLFGPDRPAGGSKLARDMVARGRHILSELVVLTPLPKLWMPEDEETDEVC